MDLSSLSSFFRGGRNGEAEFLKLLRPGGVPPNPRESHTCTCLGAKLYVFGGFDGTRVLNDLYSYDLNNMIWAQLVHTGLSPPARAGHTASALGVPAHLIVFGGANSSRRFADVQIFDTSSSNWSKPPTRGLPPASRYYHAAVLARGSLLVFGGSDGKGALGDLHALHTESWTWSQPVVKGSPPSPRHGHSATLSNKLLFILGGIGSDPGSAMPPRELSDLHVLDVEAWSWWQPELPSPLPPIAFHTAALTGDKIFVLGGSSGEAIYSDILMVDTVSAACQVVVEGAAAKLPRRRRHSAARGSGTRLLLFGGWDGGRTTGDLHELDTSGWLRLDAPNRGRPLRAPSAIEERKAADLADTRVTPSAGPSANGASGAVVRASSGAGAPGCSYLGGFGGGDGTSEEIERLQQAHREETKQLRGEIARLKMNHDSMAADLARMKALVGAQKQFQGAQGGFDVDALVTKKEFDALRLELSKVRRAGTAEVEVAQGSMAAELDDMRRTVRILEYRLAGFMEGTPSTATVALS